jgi:hypothetical protein
MSECAYHFLDRRHGRMLMGRPCVGDHRETFPFENVEIMNDNDDILRRKGRARFEGSSGGDDGGWDWGWWFECGFVDAVVIGGRW